MCFFWAFILHLLLFPISLTFFYSWLASINTNWKSCSSQPITPSFSSFNPFIVLLLIIWIFKIETVFCQLLDGGGGDNEMLNEQNQNLVTWSVSWLGNPDGSCCSFKISLRKSICIATTIATMADLGKTNLITTVPSLRSTIFVLILSTIFVLDLSLTLSSEFTSLIFVLNFFPAMI